MKKCCILLLIFNVSYDRAHTIKQKTDNLELLLSDSRDTQDRIIKVLQKIPYGIEVIDPGVKKMPTIKRLLGTSKTADEITDYSRSTIVVKNFPAIYWCLEELKKHVHIVSIDDHYLHPYPEMYMDINVIFKDPINNHIGEIQINSQAIIAVKNTIGHHIFDNIRVIRAKNTLENRPLTYYEKTLIEDLTNMSKVGYNAAFKRSYGAIRIGVYGIYIKDNHILMVKTIDGDREIYNFPGGGLENNETLAYCLQRECQEELGCNVTIGSLYATSLKLHHSSFFNSQKFNIYYEIIPHDSINESLQGAIWMSLSAMPVDKMLASDKELLAIIESKQQKKM